MSETGTPSVIILSRRVEGNQPATYDSMQSAVLPYIDSVQTFWWGVWFCILAIVVIHFIILPNWRSPREKILITGEQ
jgi:hypothetical protein